MNQKILLTFGIVLMVALFFFFKPATKITNYPSSGDSIVAFGDSLIEGVGATEGNDLVSQLSKKIGEPIINLGIAGNTTEEGVARVDRIAEYKPKVVLVLLGGNDYLRKVPKAETFKNLETIVTKVQSMGAVVVLLGVQGGVFTDPYEDLFEDLAKKKGVVYVSNVLEGLIGNQKYMSDAVHPNDAGYAKIVERVYPQLDKALQ
ncbi:MAG: GDSL-type esterase/lipase family protein [Candidatus Zambryskibacteria bacterium]|nr:GDSL-type esterase/lipase family protein [Candidatus Zambryskibacteria bacterium]